METPRGAIRLRCKDCVGGYLHEVNRCDRTSCPLYEHRTGHRPKEQEQTPVKAIRSYCLWCVNGQKEEIKLCPVKDCPIYPYRLGKNPNVSGRTKSAEALQKFMEGNNANPDKD